jgi:hypothetical protein
VNTALRSLVVWLLLLALPYQGLAAARMLPCAQPLHPAVAAAHAPAGAGAHGAASACPMHAAPAAHAAHLDAGRDHGHGGGACAACCIGVAPAPTPILPLALGPPDFIAIPFNAGPMTSVDPTLPERPPRSAFA